jgi:HlyD family secretion protein
MAETTSQEPEIEDVLGVDGASGARRRRWRYVVGGIVVLVVLAVGYLLLAGGSNGDGIRYLTTKAVRGDLTVTVTATGTIQPINTVDVSSELSGIVRKVNVEANDQVKAGQPLAELDTDKLKAQVEHARATLASKKAKLVEAQATVDELKGKYDRAKALAERGVSSAQNLETAKAAYDRALASIASAKADIKVAESDLAINELNLKKACICSPITGIVLVRNVEPGQTVASSLQAPVLFKLAEDLRKMQLEVDIDEADVGKVREGHTASFTVDAYPNERFPAKISVIRYASQTVEGVVTYKAILTIDNSELLLRPGMTATAEIVVEQVKQALLVPNTALRFTPPDTSKRDSRGLLGSLIRRGPPRFRRPSAPARANSRTRNIWILRDGEPVRLQVTVGASDGRRTQVTSGDLKEGDAVITDTAATKR